MTAVVGANVGEVEESVEFTLAGDKAAVGAIDGANVGETVGAKVGNCVGDAVKTIVDSD